MPQPDRPNPAGTMAQEASDTPEAVAQPLLLSFAARTKDPAPAQTVAAKPPAATARRGWGRLLLTGGALALVWGGLTGWDPASWVFGGPAVALATALAFSFPAAPAWRMSIPGALRFAGWFALASVRGSLDVAGRALAWRMPLAPGFRSYETDLPPGPARLVFVNAITLLPGTLSAEIAGNRIEVHMLDTESDLEAELAPLEARVRDLFALPDAPAHVPTQRRSA